MKTALATCVLVLLSIGESFAQPAATKRTTIDEGLALLDPDAGLVVSLRLSQLASAHGLAMELAPSERRAIGLAAIGAGAILGFNPFSANAWTSSGFDANTPLIAQYASSNGHSRTRIILATHSAETAKSSIERFRLGDKARPRRSRDALTPLFSATKNAPSERELRKSLQDANVFLVGRPRPLSGLLFAQQRGNLVILDLFDPSQYSFRTVLELLARRPDVLRADMPGAQSLVQGPIGVWLRTKEFGDALVMLGSSTPESKRACRSVAALGAASSIESVGIRMAVSLRTIAVDVAWHLGQDRSLLESFETKAAPLLGGASLLDARLNVSSWKLVRDRERPKEAQSWDLLWARNKVCGEGSRVYSLATSWPDILGLFLREISILHPDAKTVVDSLGPATAQVGTLDRAVTVNSEGWIHGPGTAIAKQWLESLFGSTTVRGVETRWGNGPMRPYAIDRRGGSIIGAGFRAGSRRFAFAAARRDSDKETAPAPLASLRASPSRLAPLLKDAALAPWLSPWKDAVARFEKTGAAFALSITLNR